MKPDSDFFLNTMLLKNSDAVFVLYLSMGEKLWAIDGKKNLAAKQYILG